MSGAIEQDKKRGVISSLALFFQSGYTSLLGFLSFFLISFKSTALILGIYNTVLATLNFLNYITNLGLSAALIHKKDIDDKDLNSVFYFQIGITSAAVIIGIIFTNQVLYGFNNLPEQAVYIYWAVLISFIFFTLKVPPSILLEKEIKIYKNVFVQIVENTIFYLSIILFTFWDKPLEGIVVGILSRAVAGVIITYILRPWRPRLIFSIPRLKRLLSYGIIFQGNSFLSLIKDDFVIIYLSKTIGLANLGYLTFAKKYAEIFIRIVNDNLNRVFFPLFSKYQDQKDKLQYLLQIFLKYNSLLSFPLIVGTALIFPDFLKVFPSYYQKWSQSIGMFYLFSIASLFVIFNSPLINFFNAIGKVKTSLKFMVFWTALMWVGVVVAVNVFEYYYIPVVFILIGLSFLLVIKVAKGYLEFSILPSVKTALISTLSLTSGVFLIKMILPYLQLPSLQQVLLMVLAGASAYIGTVIALETTAIVKKFIKILKR